MYKLYYNDNRIRSVRIEYLPVGYSEGDDIEDMEFDQDEKIGDYGFDFDELRIIYAHNTFVISHLNNDKLVKRHLINVEDISSTEIMEVLI
jgi:hypothetical protein